MRNEGSQMMRVWPGEYSNNVPIKAEEGLEFMEGYNHMNMMEYGNENYLPFNFDQWFQLEWYDDMTMSEEFEN